MPFKFHGGVHPNYMKAPDVPVTVIAPPPQVVLPMMQHIGAPCKPLVATIRHPSPHPFTRRSPAR